VDWRSTIAKPELIEKDNDRLSDHVCIRPGLWVESNLICQTPPIVCDVRMIIGWFGHL
jgi:hypothetical protein